MRAYLSARRRLLRDVDGADAAEPGRGVPATGRGSSAAAVDAVAAMACGAGGRAGGGKRQSSGAEPGDWRRAGTDKVAWLRAELNWNRDGMGSSSGKPVVRCRGRRPRNVASGVRALAGAVARPPPERVAHRADRCSSAHSTSHNCFLLAAASGFKSPILFVGKRQIQGERGGKICKACSGASKVLFLYEKVYIMSLNYCAK